jgi:peptidoglycan hydrolase-like protein with peptidoglycan-binding domain
MALDKTQKIFVAGGVAFAAVGIYLLWPKTASAATPKLPVSPSKPAAPGANASVQTVQAALKAAGYDPGPADGQMGPKTAAALKAFQAAKGLPVTGQIDGATSAVLFGGAAAQKAPSGSSTGPRTVYIPGYPDAISCNGAGYSDRNSVALYEYIEGLKDAGTLDAIATMLGGASPACYIPSKQAADRAANLRSAAAETAPPVYTETIPTNPGSGTYY